MEKPGFAQAFLEACGEGDKEDIFEASNSEIIKQALFLIICEENKSEKAALDMLANINEKYGYFGSAFVTAVAEVFETILNHEKKLDKRDFIVDFFSLDMDD